MSTLIEVVGSNLARGKIFTASIGSVDSLYPSVYMYIYIYTRKKNNNILIMVNSKVKHKQVLCGP